MRMLMKTCSLPAATTLHQESWAAMTQVSPASEQTSLLACDDTTKALSCTTINSDGGWYHCIANMGPPSCLSCHAVSSDALKLGFDPGYLSHPRTMIWPTRTMQLPVVLITQACCGTCASQHLVRCPQPAPLASAATLSWLSHHAAA